MGVLINNIHEKISRCLSSRNAHVSRSQEKLRLQLRHQGTVQFINLLGKGLTPMACMGDGGSISWAPDSLHGPPKFG